MKQKFSAAAEIRRILLESPGELWERMRKRDPHLRVLGLVTVEFLRRALWVVLRWSPVAFAVGFFGRTLTEELGVLPLISYIVIPVTAVIALRDFTSRLFRRGKEVGTDSPVAPVFQAACYAVSKARLNQAVVIAYCAVLYFFSTMYLHTDRGVIYSMSDYHPLAPGQSQLHRFVSKAHDLFFYGYTPGMRKQPRGEMIGTIASLAFSGLCLLDYLLIIVRFRAGKYGQSGLELLEVLTLLQKKKGLRGGGGGGPRYFADEGAQVSTSEAGPDAVTVTS